MKADNGNSKPKTGKKCPCKGLTNSKTSKPKHPKGWVNPVCTRVENIDRIRKAYIMWEDIPIAELYHEYASISGEFDWVIKPIWENWDKCRERGEYVDIAGIDDTLHKDEYIRRYNPEFVTQRTIPEGRADLFPLLEAIGLTHNDLFEVLCRTHGRCGNDDYYVSRTPDIVINTEDVFSKQYDIPNFDTKDYGWLY